MKKKILLGIGIAALGAILCVNIMVSQFSSNNVFSLSTIKKALAQSEGGYSGYRERIFVSINSTYTVSCHYYGFCVCTNTSTGYACCGTGTLYCTPDIQVYLSRCDCSGGCV